MCVCVCVCFNVCYDTSYKTYEDTLRTNTKMYNWGPKIDFKSECEENVCLSYVFQQCTGDSINIPP